MSTFTKQALADTLKQMVQTRALDKITVKDLVEACHINRQTFYYHFQDIYDLLGWIYKSEALASIQHLRSYATWQQGLLTVFDYVRSNKQLCMTTYSSLAREHLERFLHEVSGQLLGDVVDEITGSVPLLPQKRAFIVRFYSYAFSGVLLEWIKEGMKTSSEELVEDTSLIMEGNLKAAVRRLTGAGQSQGDL